MKAEILTVGDELLLGFTTDTNSRWLSRELAGIGVEVVRHTSVADERGEIGGAVLAALDRTGCVITSGGLGPTSDDLTVESIALALGRPLLESSAVVAHLEAMFAAHGMNAERLAANRRQALVIEGSEVLLNNHGTAPGLWINDDGRYVAMLPGVPREMRGIFNDEVRGRMAALAGSGVVVTSRTLRTTGIAESLLSAKILASGISVNSLAYLPGWEGVDLRVTVRGHSRDDADRMVASDIAALRTVAGSYAYADGDADLAEIVLGMARVRSMRIAVAESCTGGLVGARLTAVPGASEVFPGGVISYDNSVKEQLLFVPAETLVSHGAVSEAAVRAMAAGARRQFGSDISIAVSGIAGPAGGSAEKPVGTVWVCVDVGGNATSEKRTLPGDREEVRLRASQLAFDILRRRLAEI